MPGKCLSHGARPAEQPTQHPERAGPGGGRPERTREAGHPVQEVAAVDHLHAEGRERPIQELQDEKGLESLLRQ